MDKRPGCWWRGLMLTQIHTPAARGSAPAIEWVPATGGHDLAQHEIDAIRTLLGSKPRPVGWSERRQRLDEVGAAWPVASDVKCEAVDCDGVPGEWSVVPGSEAS